MVHGDGTVTLTLPAWASAVAGEGFVARHAEWLRSKVARAREFAPHPASRHGRAEYLLHREAARTLVASRLAAFAPALGVAYGRVAIRAQRSCSGSCSRAGNLNFNYKLQFLPPRLQDYVIVHELAHLREHNHSARFWTVVGGVLPDWRSLRHELREIKMLY